MNLPATFDLTDKTALVTGASRGLGRHFAIELARAGVDVAITARSLDALADIMRETRLSSTTSTVVVSFISKVLDIRYA